MGESGDIVELIQTSPTLKTHLDYRRFQGESVKVLLLKAPYHLVGETSQALRLAGHSVSEVEVEHEPSAMMRSFLKALVENKPDFVLTINHLGFDAAGRMGELLENFEIPVAAWYVDSPLFVLRGNRVPGASVTTLFTWERSLLPVYKAHCHAEYLPLATEPSTFSGSRTEGEADGVAFVGNSGFAAQQKWKRRLGVHQDERVYGLATKVAERSVEHFRNPELLTDELQADLLAAATWQANSTLRARFLRPFLAEPQFVLYGDSDWPQVLEGATPTAGPNYGVDLAEVYRRHAVHLNITSLQMPTAVNQRVFDAPAAGGFLLTDAQEDLLELFDEDELAVWNSEAEAIDKARFYLKNPHRRAELIERGRNRVLSDHTYGHRVETLVATMRKRFGSTTLAATGS